MPTVKKAGTRVLLCCVRHRYEYSQGRSHYNAGQAGCKHCITEKRSLVITKYYADRYETRKAEFIRRSAERHGNKFDHGKTEYGVSGKKVILFCTVDGHGRFNTSPTKHLSGLGGCPVCSRLLTNLASKRASVLSNERGVVSLNKAINRFPLLSLEKFIYTRSNHKSIVICSKHDEFLASPNYLISSATHGCPKCAKEAISASSAKAAAVTVAANSRKFIDDSMLAHTDANGFCRVDYSKTVYTGVLKRCTFICKIHNNEFTQKAEGHRDGHRGCPLCKMAKKFEDAVKVELDKHGIVYEYQKSYRVNGKQYYVDFFLPLHQIHVEVDEEHHLSQIDQDVIRQSEIESVSGVGFHRYPVKKSENPTKFAKLLVSRYV
jgi:very-short-patch-repair endonuclease